MSRFIDWLLGSKPCSCPVAFRAYIEGERCARHGEATEAARRPEVAR